MKALLITIVVVCCFLIVMAFGARNDVMVNINYFIAQGEFALPMVLAAVFFGGFVISWLITMTLMIQQRFKLNRARFKIQQLEKRLNDLDALDNNA
ncbi:LapA family protein [Ferrimonas aestuarii]|uniref:Probable lipopolysaccharide assembly protein A n=1 Tax=Ferrimonas aestuarii TaxID=2569539 RepID=A0A4U1BU14_9GAMM|nr:lipopolysaccharide assembly protein LapA domain-containing protein [Ferrimonas aestuarii]TKB57515.1 DUF1049 domain-containing protein [Ferrimonas aestuarii]